jgi:hypothetical protein
MLWVRAIEVPSSGVALFDCGMLDLQPEGCAWKFTNTDRIEKKIVLGAARSRVWRSIAVAVELGLWFGCETRE